MPTKFMFREAGKYYPIDVWEFNIPAGYTCCGAGEDCKTIYDPKNRKYLMRGKEYVCYASLAERVPAVSTQRHRNFQALLDGEPICPLPPGAEYVRIHGSGDFFSQKYFDMWLAYVKKYPDVIFWAFTKSIDFWVKRKNEIPDNFILIASKGGLHDNLIEEEFLRYAEVFDSIEEAEASGLPVDYDDSITFGTFENVALLKKARNKKERLEHEAYIAKLKEERKDILFDEEYDEYS